MELKIETARAFLPLLRPAKYCAAYGGRSSGKSRFFAGKLIERCVSRPTRAVCVREVQQSIAESVKQAIEDEIRRQGLASAFRMQEQRTETPYGGHIIYHGMKNHTAESIK